MRVLLDTNVWIAAFVSRGACHELVEYCKRTHTLVTSDSILSEFERTLLKKFEVPGARAREARALIEMSCEVATPRAPAEPASRDPDDDAVLAAAVAGDCHCLVTGDQDLLLLEEYGNVPIHSPAGFWAFEAGERRAGT